MNASTDSKTETDIPVIQTRRERSADNPIHADRGSSVINLNLSGALLIAFVCVIAGVILAAAFVSCFLSAAAWVASQNATAAADREAREAKQVEIQLMYTNAIMIRDGSVRPGDMVFGPEGNLEYDGHKFIKPLARASK
jgi:hypothetical protein